MSAASARLHLAHWRRSVAELYAAVRRAAPEARLDAWNAFRRGREALFLNHPQSPLNDEQRAAFQGLNYFEYDPSWRVLGKVDPHIEGKSFEARLVEEGVMRYTRVARVAFSGPAGEATLNLFWVEGYGGGLFLPFKDATCGKATYGGGRYLYDGIKGADLGAGAEALVLDFNYAYNPSCAYDARWICPLASPENVLPFEVQAGEQDFIRE